MRYDYDEQAFDVELRDDGSLDTLIAVNGIVFRFDSEYARTPDGGIFEEAIYTAIEKYLETQTPLTNEGVKNQ